MNSNTSNQKSQKAEKMASGKQRGNNGRRGDSTMQSSEHDGEMTHPSPLRVAAARPEGTEFKVAGLDHGGAMRQKTQPSSDVVVVDEKGFTLPL
ncbi:hypothetical protein BGZ94_008541, partial [Podila epigama]